MNFIAELPKVPVISSLNGQDLSSQAPIFDIGAILNLSCEVTGGMFYYFIFKNITFLSYVTRFIHFMYCYVIPTLLELRRAFPS